MLEHAMSAVQRGWYVFPCEEGGKKPHPGIGNWGEIPWDYFKADHAAYTRTVVSWWQKWPNANVAITCKPSKLLVIDLDTAKSSAEASGEDEFNAYVQYKARQRSENPAAALTQIWDTYTVSTPSGGMHLYFRWDRGLVAQRIKLGDDQFEGVCKNVDIRANGGPFGNYVLGPGSKTEAGVYRVHENRDPVPDTPIWLRRTVARPHHPRMNHKGGKTEFSSRAGLLEGLANAQEGNRNNYLTWVAKCFRDEGVDVDKATEELSPVASKIGLDEREIERTIRSAYRK